MSRRAIRRALVSVFDKAGIEPFVRALHEREVEIVSTGGTAQVIAEAGLPVREVSDLTGFPEMLDGRVKTLHPRVHGGLLARRGSAEHMNQAREHGIEMIDLVAINLYPFERTLSERPDDTDGIIEMIDIGGPAMVRSAAKNFRDVVVLVDPADYERVLEEIDGTGGIGDNTRTRLAAKAFEHTSVYDALIADFMTGLRAREAGEIAERFPERTVLMLRKVRDLRYGENPHQTAALYADPLESGAGVVGAEQLHGRELSFNNILDLDAAWGLVTDFIEPACAIIKHANPAGAALGLDPADAYRRALACDPVSAFGGIVAFNRDVSEDAARHMADTFLEAIIAPGYQPSAIEALRARKNLRILKAPERPPVDPGGRDFKRVTGGMLLQDRDGGDDGAGFRVVTDREPDGEERAALEFAWTVVRHVRSNAIVYALGTATAGVGAGQMSRVDAVKFGAMKAAVSLKGSVLASDAFFPFRDGLDEAARAGVRAVIQPGGSVRDEEVIAAANEHGMAMIFTDRRHFKH